MPTFENMSISNSNNDAAIQQSSDAANEPVNNVSQSQRITRSRSRNMTSIARNDVTSTNTNNRNQVTSINDDLRTM